MSKGVVVCCGFSLPLTVQTTQYNYCYSSDPWSSATYLQLLSTSYSLVLLGNHHFSVTQNIQTKPDLRLTTCERLAISLPIWVGTFRTYMFAWLRNEYKSTVYRVCICVYIDVAYAWRLYINTIRCWHVHVWRCWCKRRRPLQWSKVLRPQTERREDNCLRPDSGNMWVCCGYMYFKWIKTDSVQYIAVSSSYLVFERL